MKISTWLRAAALALMLGPPALAADPIAYTNADGVNATPVSAANPLPTVAAGGGPYALLSNASASGAAVAGIKAGSYILTCVGTFGGATAALKTLGPDGATFVQVTTMTTPTAVGVVLGANATAEVTLTGGTPSGLYCSLS